MLHRSRQSASGDVVLPLSLPAILTVVIFAFTLTLQEFVHALTFISSPAPKPITLGVATDPICGDIFFLGEIMAGALLASISVAIAHNLFLDRSAPASPAALSSERRFPFVGTTYKRDA